MRGISCGPGKRMSARQKTLTIQTPEGIVFPLVIADPLTRLLALGVDQACIYIVSGTASLLLSMLRLVSLDVAGAAAILSSAALSLAYPIVLEWYWHGQTLGKRLFRLQVMDVQGLRLQFSQIVIRNLLRVVDVLPGFYLVGGLASFLSAKGQRLGDLAANAIVVCHPRVAEPDMDQVLPGKFNSFAAYPHLAARLRQNVSPREAQVTVHALLRRGELDAEARLALFGTIRRHMERIVKFPEEVTEGLSDEQYVRNVVDLLFRR